MTEKIAPVQGYAAGIPWSMHLRAYDAYCKKYGTQQAMIEGGCRGGFHASELDDFIPGWRDDLSEISQLRAQIGKLYKVCNERDVLRNALVEAREAIAHLDPMMALGGQHANHPEEQEWYFRDELLSRIDAALNHQQNVAQPKPEARIGPSGLCRHGFMRQLCKECR